MPRLTAKQRAEIHEKTVSVLHHLLSFHVSFSSIEFIHDEATVKWRELEARLHNDYPIKGIGVKATRKNLKTVDESDGGFLHTEEDLSPSEVPSELQSFPYRAASAAYAFTLLEGYGDDVSELVNPGQLKSRQAWHHGVYGDANLRDRSAFMKAREAFAKPFSRQSTKVPRFAVQRLVEIKAIRNEFMHEGYSNVDFQEFFSYVLCTVLVIYFLVLPSMRELSVYPYFDYHGKWRDS